VLDIKLVLQATSQAVAALADTQLLAAILIQVVVAVAQVM
jgi:hypothetical protein